MEVSGITERKLNEILESYRASAEYRELMIFLSPFGATPKKAERIQQHFGAEAVNIVKKEPYRLCEISGFGFLTVDPIARASQDFKPDAPDRIKAAIVYVMKAANEEGQLYLEVQDVIKRAEELLNKGLEDKPVPLHAVRACGNELVNADHVLSAERIETPCLVDGQIQMKQDYAIYIEKMARAEKEAAYHLVRLLKQPVPVSLYEVERQMDALQKEAGIQLAKQQKEAIRMVFRSSVSIITGGPGKGKTTIVEPESVDGLDCCRILMIDPFGRNADAAAVRYAGERLEERPEKKKVLIIVSDGKPNAPGHTGQTAVTELQNIKRELEKKGTAVFAAAIGDDRERIREIYGKGFLNISNLNDFPKKLVQLLWQYLT